MTDRHFPVRPNLDQWRRQAKELLRRYRQGDPGAVEDFERFSSKPSSLGQVRLADAQHVLARSHGIAGWPRLVLACKLIDAIWQDDERALQALLKKHPDLLHEMARGTQGCNWGPPMSYAANLCRN